MLKLEFTRLGNMSGHQAGRMLLEQMYRKETGNAFPPVRIAPGGKPYLENSPYHFSITHTRRHAFCALSDHPVGIDAEELDRRVRPELAQKILSPGEYAVWAASADPQTDLLRFWVLKEAAVKLTGAGLHGYPCTTDFSPDDPRIQIIDGCLVALIQ